MSIFPRLHLSQLPRHYGPRRLFSSSERLAAGFDFNGLHSRLTSRQLPLLYDRMSEKPEMLLANTLSEFLPSIHKSKKIHEESELRDSPLPLGHHIVYFPPTSLLSELLPDGTDPEQSPGGPFVRRMWAGGNVRFPKTAELLKLDNRHACCFERLSDVKVKGKEGDEKIFVTIERRISHSPNLRTGSAWKTRDDISELLMHDANCAVIEDRNLVFMKERSPEELKAAESSASKIVKASSSPTVTHAYLPTRPLLFRFSALTWNAHQIHLDKSYCRDIEGHRDLLVHGPLSFVMLLELIQRYQAGETGTNNSYPFNRLNSFEYRNLAPLYVGEECKLCLREGEKGKYDLWIENGQGGMCVKGTAFTE
jgi:hydroxyacyl-ACP dehydratase HTD2-like protein with hotdog domain